MAKKASKKKATKKKKAPEANEEELDAAGAGESINEDDGLEEGDEDQDDSLDSDEEELELDADESDEEADADEEEPPAKKAKADASDEGETVQSKVRKKEAARANAGQPKVLEKWYEFKRGNTYNEKKGLKLVEYRRTKNGAQSTYVGWEKKIPKSFLKKIRASGELRE